MTYELIAFDMDGTLLDSKKEVLPSSVEAMREAHQAGKTIAICSGRCPSMVELHSADFPLARYAICGSGSTLYDLTERRVLSEHSFDDATIRSIADASDGEDVMIDAFSDRDFYFQGDALDIMDHFGIGIYTPLYATCGNPVKDIRSFMRTSGLTYQKINIHCASAKISQRVAARLEGLSLELAPSESTSLELSPAGINKGMGLLALADLLGIDHAATIAVGDSDNDLAMLRMAGLGLAMANANEAARETADLVLEHDNDHGGCAEAVRRFLLGDAATGDAAGADAQ